MQNGEDPEIMARLEQGEVLMIDDQMRSYISLECGDAAKPIIMRSALAWLDDEMKRVDMQPKYEEKRFRSLAEALLSLTDYKWC